MILKAKKLGGDRYCLLSTKICISKQMLLGAIVQTIKTIEANKISRTKIVQILRISIINFGSPFFHQFKDEINSEEIMSLARKYFPDWFGENSQQFIVEK